MDAFPMTPEEVMAAREAVGFTTPLAPVEVGSMWFVFDSRGTYEFMVHPRDAAHYLEHGITIDGKLLEDVIKVDEWPMIGAWHLRAMDNEANRVFTPSVRVPQAALELDVAEPDPLPHEDPAGDRLHAATPQGRSSATISR